MEPRPNDQLGIKLFHLAIPRRGIDWITANTVKGKHWGTVHRQRSAWAMATSVAATQARLGRDFPPAVLCSVFYFRQHRTRDPLNFADTLKPIVDHLIGIRKCWPDDNPMYLTQLAPEIVVGGEEGVELFAYERLDTQHDRTTL